MADEQYRWLDRETAERLLRGESLEAVDAADRDQAERLAKTLGALSVDPPASAELPGEAAALAAFRKARTDRVDDWVGDPADAGTDARAWLGHRFRTRSSDAGLVRIGRPDPAARHRRRTRPVRLGLAAALAVGMVGGVAVAAVTGALPFGDAEPDPAASVSAAVTPDRPLATPSPKVPESEPAPDGDTGQGSSRDTARGGSATPDDGPGTGSGADGQEGRSGEEWSGAAAACRAVRDGEELAADRRRSLEGAAGGSAKVWKYCNGVLASGSSGSSDSSGSSGEGADSNGQGGKGDQNAQEDNEVKDDRGDRDGRDAGEADTGSQSSAGNDHDTDGGFATPSAAVSPTPQRAMTSYGPTPGPTYSAL
ncbi:hypothetical protein ADK57_23715 [Streptomyces sp. MMG1533]|uniref:hypothetical protein n=1 Tax=Streptomyces sp. MMG1533 TaxID=1415546 RepID=UPI0006C19A07|nr:hypothetical protein [Streptomyces sp. MMG1533]KOU62808.1 hypothetical protein ADK57_23715 [Streptomyces sp. MMG1533]